eukprot:Skav224036  [mRNA]  locus=scaffold5785:375:815:+ [translate_table: standard]
MKKPSKNPNAGLSVNDSVKNLKRGLGEAGEEGAETHGKEVALRDKGKGEKWARMRAAGAIPPHILHLHDEGAKNSSNTRDFRTQVINALFEKNDKGVFELATQKKMFTEAFKVYQKKYARDESEGLAKSILCGLYFQNDEKARAQR